MPKKAQLKTTKNDVEPLDFINSVEKDSLREDSTVLLRVFEEASGMPAAMWGNSIIGFGQYTYHRANGDEAEFMACGFSPRKSGPVLYIIPGYQNYADILAKLGPHKLGKSCLYLKSLKNIDLEILTQLIETGLKDLKSRYKTNY